VIHSPQVRNKLAFGIGMVNLRMLTDLFTDPGFMPHIHCYLDEKPLIWTMLITDLLIGLAYVAISITLIVLIRRIKLQFSLVVFCFGVFILACGLTHFMEIYTLWHPVYWIAAFIKLITAIASVGTGIYLYRLRHSLVAVAEAAKLSEERRLHVEKVNLELSDRTLQLEQMNQTLEEQQKVLAHSAKMSALGEMAGGIAHEINSPLGIITLHANQIERMQKRGSLTPEIILEEAQLIASTAKRIGDIIKGLRAFAREGEKDPFLFTPVDSIVHDALVLCESRFKTNGVALKVDPIPAGLQVECRGVQITQVVLNLLTNSFDAIQSLEQKWIQLSVSDNALEVKIEVTDSGLGISPEILNRLFQPFFTTKEVGKGTGLGLSISKGIMNAHGGVLEYDDSSEHTRFVLKLPKSQIRQFEVKS
jgi:C4-dicarboxylate-specific signal transduction histidine kinase